MSETIKLGTHYAMLMNARDNISQSIQNIGKLKPIDHIRIFNKEGEIKFSNSAEEVGEKNQYQGRSMLYLP